jgi:hypothetical protein
MAKVVVTSLKTKCKSWGKTSVTEKRVRDTAGQVRPKRRLLFAIVFA